MVGESEERWHVRTWDVGRLKTGVKNSAKSGKSLRNSGFLCKSRTPPGVLRLTPKGASISP